MTTNDKNPTIEGAATIANTQQGWTIAYLLKGTEEVLQGPTFARLFDAHAWCVVRGLEVQEIETAYNENEGD